MNSSSHVDEGVDASQAHANYDAPRILLMGARRSGKSSIERVVFQKMSPHETLLIESTNTLEVSESPPNPHIQFLIMDFPGDVDFAEGLHFGEQKVTGEMILESHGAVVYVIDAQDKPYHYPIQNFIHTVRTVKMYNEAFEFEVFVHKVDGDLFVSDEAKGEVLREIQKQVLEGLKDAELESVKVTFHQTSIYDHSVYGAFSKVVQKLIPQLPTIENILNILLHNCKFEKLFLFDVLSKVYIATDSEPVNMSKYELCSDMVDVAVDVSCIYGFQGAENEVECAVDSKSASLIRLNNGLVLYLREVGRYLVLVCIVRSDNFTKRGLIDYNIDCFKQLLSEVFSGDINTGNAPNFINEATHDLLNEVKLGGAEVFSVTSMVDNGADIEARDREEMDATILMIAASRGKSDCVEALLRLGADTSARNSKGDSALSLAARVGDLKCVQALIQYNADVSAKNENNDTPLIEASQSGHSKIVECLVKNGADASATNVNGHNAVALARTDEIRSFLNAI